MSAILNAKSATDAIELLVRVANTRRHFVNFNFAALGFLLWPETCTVCTRRKMVYGSQIEYLTRSQTLFFVRLRIRSTIIELCNDARIRKFTFKGHVVRYR